MKIKLKMIVLLLLLTVNLFAVYEQLDVELSSKIENYLNKVSDKGINGTLIKITSENISICDELKKEGEILFSQIENKNTEFNFQLARTIESFYHRNTMVTNPYKACSEDLYKAFYYRKFTLTDLGFAIAHVQGDFNFKIDHKKAFEYAQKAELKFSGGSSILIINKKIFFPEVVIGQFYEFGIGTSKDLSKAITYYKNYFDNSKNSLYGDWKYAGLRLASYYAKNQDKEQALKVLNQLLVESSSLESTSFMMESNNMEEYAKYIPELKDESIINYLKKDVFGEITLDLEKVIIIYKSKYNLV